MRLYTYNLTEDHTEASSQKKPRQRQRKRKASEVKQNPKTVGRLDRITIRTLK